MYNVLNLFLVVVCLVFLEILPAQAETTIVMVNQSNQDSLQVSYKICDIAVIPPQCRVAVTPVIKSGSVYRFNILENLDSTKKILTATAVNVTTSDGQQYSKNYNNVANDCTAISIGNALVFNISDQDQSVYCWRSAVAY